ncbi:MAG: ABC transporter ATP-binding protein [Kiritimatiellia bacterium]|nr:ABC transporter ATP-binding protein [Lentisphaerota bacterium]
MIKVENLTRKFAGVIAVDRACFEVARGDIVGILGPNGAGKTTTLRILSGYLAPTSGEVSIDGLTLGEHSLEIRRRLGYLPEHVPLYPEMRVREYLKFRARLKGVPRSRIRSRLTAVTELCDLQEVAGRIIGQLSQGNRQRVGLADALIHEPQLLILDEPTIGLDPNQIRSIRQTIRNLAGRYTVVLSTHFLAEAEMVCRRVLIMHRGRIVAADTPDQLARLAAGNLCLTLEINAAPDRAETELRALPGIYEVDGGPCRPASGSAGWFVYNLKCAMEPDHRPAIFELIRRQGWLLREMHSERKNLEDVFAALTTAGEEDK